MEQVALKVGDTVFFGWKRTPNIVTRVASGNNQCRQIIGLRGPRGGESTAFVRLDGSVRKV